jgi:hypothetical protein
VKSFDLYQPSWEFLKDSPKFVSVTFEQAAPPERTQCKLFSPNGSIDTPGLDTPVIPQPIGKKKSKKTAGRRKNTTKRYRNIEK